MERIDEQHLAESGLVVFHVTAANEGTALQVMGALERLRAASGTATLRRTPGAPGIQARVYADTRRSGAAQQFRTGCQQKLSSNKTTPQITHSQEWGACDK